MVNVDLLVESANTLMIDAIKIADEGSIERAEFRKALGKGRDVCSAAELSSSTFMLTAACTDYFVVNGALSNHLPSHKLTLAKRLADHGQDRFLADLEAGRDLDLAAFQAQIYELLVPEITTFFKACVSLATSDTTIARSFAGGRGGGVNTIFEVSVVMNKILDKLNAVPAGFRRCTVDGRRVFYVNARALPTLELLPKGSCRAKSLGASSMCGDSGDAAALEVGVQDAVLFGGAADAKAAVLVRDHFRNVVRNSVPPARGGRWSEPSAFVRERADPGAAPPRFCGSW